MEHTLNIDTPEGMAAAVAWQRKWNSGINEGGAWIVPNIGAIIRIHHSIKTAEVISSLFPIPPHYQRVFEAMGWTWKGENVERN